MIQRRGGLETICPRVQTSFFRRMSVPSPSLEQTQLLHLNKDPVRQPYSVIGEA